MAALGLIERFVPGAPLSQIGIDALPDSLLSPPLEVGVDGKPKRESPLEPSPSTSRIQEVKDRVQNGT